MARIEQQNILEMYEKDTIRYAMEVNRQRAIPDYRDGLKTVARRILDFMFFDLPETKRHPVKSVKIVGGVLGKTHGHGDTSSYEAFVPMTNIYQSKHPLIKGQGNWGTKSGGAQAAMRYTEAMLSEFCLEVVINDLSESKTIIDWKPNFDNTTVEPEYLAPAVPLLLINGTFGIGYGIKVDIPKHNLIEVIDATLSLIKDPDSEIVLIPDQCMPVQIFDTNWKQICNIGHGQYKVRGVIDIEYDKDKPLVIIKSTPDMVTLNSVIGNINKLISAKQLPQIYDMNDEDSKGKYPLRYVIELKRGSDPNFVRDIIYKKTQMEKTTTINFEVLDGIDLLRMSYKAYLHSFIEFRKITKFRLYCARLQQYESKLHEKEIYIMLLQSGKIDNVIHRIRNRKESDDGELIEWIMREFQITPPQAKFIINVNLKNLSIGYLNKYIEEANVLKIKRQECLDVITDDNKIINIIIQELEYFKQKYGKPRICQVINPKNISDVPAGEFKIIITENNYIKKVPVNMNIGNFRQDAPKVVIKGDNRESILIFDEMGRVFNLPIDKIPMSDKNSNGVDIRLILKKLTSNINTIIYEPLVKDLSKKVQKYYLTMVTKNGNIKKLDLEDITTVPPSGILLMKLDEGDVVKEIKVIHNAFDIIVYSKSKALRMSLNDVPHQKRNTKGMKSMNNHDMIDGMSIITPDMTDVITITESGKVNRFNVSGLPSLGRNKSGSKVIKLSKGDSIHSILTVNENNIITVITKSGRMDLVVKDIELNSSISPGIKLIPLKNDNIIRVEVKR